MKNLLKLGTPLTKEAQKTVIGGRYMLASCPSGEMQCSCNGADYGCVCSVSECWDMCS